MRVDRHHEVRDLLLVLVLAVTAFLLTGAPTLLRVPFSVPAVLLLPGYALVAVLFVDDAAVSLIERVALSLGASIGIVAVQGVLLDRSMGLTPDAIRAVVSGCTVGLVLVALIRRLRFDGPVRLWASKTSQRPGSNRFVRFTQTLVVSNLVVAAAAFALTVGDQPDTATEFYVLGEAGRLGSYPRDLGPSGTATFTLGIVQPADRADSYRVAIRSGVQVLREVGPLQLQRAQKWEEAIEVALPTSGQDQDLTLELFREDQTAPMRTLRLWVNFDTAVNGP